MIVRSVVCYSLSLSAAGADAMGHLRVAAPYHHMGIRVIPGVEDGRIMLDRVAEGDVVILQRELPGQFADYQRVIQSARRQGKPVVFDLDDLLLSLPEDHPDRLRQYYAPSLLPMLQALMEADLVTVPTPKLRDVLAGYSRNLAVLPNYLDDGLWRLKPPATTSSSQVLTIGYMGTDSHKPDLEFVTPVLLDLAKRYPQRVRFRFWGVQPSAEMRSLPQVEWTPLYSLSYKEFAAFFQTQSADIFIAPLADNAFNRCKSPLKFLEYSALGAPGVFSRMETYTDLVGHGQNGLLAGSPEEWEACLVQLIEDDDLRLRLATNAQATIRANWLLSQNVFRWQEVLQNLSVSLRQPESPYSVLPSINRQLSEAFVRRDTEALALTAQVAEKERAVQSLMAQVAEKEQAVQSLMGQMAEKERAVQSLTAQIAEREYLLSEIHRSKAWRTAMAARRLRVLLLPPGSLRARIAGKIGSLLLRTNNLAPRVQP